MPYFTHQNTTINSISVDTESKFELPDGRSHLSSKFDDNVNIRVENIAQIGNRCKTTLATQVIHPDFKYTILSLDSHEHLLPDLL